MTFNPAEIFVAGLVMVGGSFRAMLWIFEKCAARDMRAMDKKKRYIVERW